jgi:hypothetical protein
LISTKQNGIDIQMYMAIIACMLISLWTGRKPTKRTYEMVCYYFIGTGNETVPGPNGTLDAIGAGKGLSGDRLGERFGGGVEIDS